MEDIEYDVFEDYEVGQAFNIPTYKNEPNDAETKVQIEKAEDIRDEENVIMETDHIREIQAESYQWNKDETGLERKVSQSENDTSFNEYVRKSNKQPQGRILKWLMRTAKLVLFIMLLPLNSLLAGLIGGGIVALLGGGIGLICLSIGTLIGAAFFLSFLNLDLIFLMLSLIITLAATGGLILLTGVLCCKVLVKGIKYYRMKKSRHVRDGEEKIA